MVYVLALLHSGKNFGERSFYSREHEKFIDSLIRGNVVLMGGSLEPPIDDIEAAYLLHCNTLSEAKEWANRDPYVQHSVFVHEFVEWKLVGINTKAIDPSLIITPDTD